VNPAVIDEGGRRICGAAARRAPARRAFADLTLTLALALADTAETALPGYNPRAGLAA